MTRTLKVNLVLLLSVTASLFLISECVCRYLVYVRTPDGMVFDDSLIYSYRPRTDLGWTVLNDIGCIGDDVTPNKLVNERRIFLLGGSTSFSRDYVDGIRKYLQPSYPHLRISVMSCGRPRYTSYVNRVNLERYLLSYSPDVVVMYMGINDNIYNSFPWLSGPPTVGFFNWHDMHTSLALTLAKYYLLDKKLRSTPDFAQAASLRSVPLFRSQIEEIVRLTTASGATPVLSTFAMSYPTSDNRLKAKIVETEPTMLHFWGTVDSTVVGVRAHNAVMRNLAQQYSLPLADVEGTIPADSEHFVDICHLTPAGYRSLTAAIARAIPELKGP